MRGVDLNSAGLRAIGEEPVGVGRSGIDEVALGEWVGEWRAGSALVELRR
jgi:hypothetical protein